jgi:hypothetical protein
MWPYVLPLSIIPPPIGVLSAIAALTGISSAGTTPSTVARALSVVVFICAASSDELESRPGRQLRSDQRCDGDDVTAITGILL